MCNTHFYTILSTHGVTAALKCLKRGEFDAAKVNVVFIPVHLQQSTHWSLAAVLVHRPERKTTVLLLDSITKNRGHHKAGIKINLSRLLEKLYPSYDLPNFIIPSIEAQKNGVDCGLFVMQYILRIVQFGEQQMLMVDVENIQSLVLNFNQKNVTTMRSELHTLITNLGTLQQGKCLSSKTKTKDDQKRQPYSLYGTTGNKDHFIKKSQKVKATHSSNQMKVTTKDAAVTHEEALRSATTKTEHESINKIQAQSEPHIRIRCYETMSKLSDNTGLWFTADNSNRNEEIR